MPPVNRNVILKNSIWRFCERFLAQLLTTIVSVVLARILTPDDYGAVAIIMVFINLCNILVSKGFSSSLIQKKDTDDLDYSVAFYISLAVTAALYLTLYLSAPLVAAYYGIPILKPLLRVMAIRLPFTAVNSVQNAYVARNFQYKKYFFATIGGTLLSAFVGIGMAYGHCGAWALVGQYLSSTIINSVILWFTVKWRPKRLFSASRAVSLTSYGWKILLSAVLDEINIELNSFVIGKRYSSADLAFYTKGKQFPQIINTNVNETITGIMFSVFSKEQSNPALMKAHLKKALQNVAFVMFPMLLGMAAVSEEFLLILLTEKWSSSIPFMQIACISFLFNPINSLNIQAVKATGASGQYLKMTFAKTVISVTVILMVAPFGVHQVALAAIFNAFFATYLQSLPLKKMIDYGFLEELRDLFPIFVLSVVMMLAALSVGLLNLPLWLSLVVKMAVGAAVYIGLAKLFRIECLAYLFDIILGRIRKKK